MATDKTESFVQQQVQQTEQKTATDGRIRGALGGAREAVEGLLGQKRFQDEGLQYNAEKETKHNEILELSRKVRRSLIESGIDANTVSEYSSYREVLERNSSLKGQLEGIRGGINRVLDIQDDSRLAFSGGFRNLQKSCREYMKSDSSLQKCDKALGYIKKGITQIRADMLEMEQMANRNFTLCIGYDDEEEQSVREDLRRFTKLQNEAQELRAPFTKLEDSFKALGELHTELNPPSQGRGRAGSR